MPRKRKQENRMISNTSAESMKNAVRMVANEGYSLRKASKHFNIPLTTLRRYVLKYSVATDDEKLKMMYEPNYFVNQIFSKEVEKELKEYLIIASKIHHG